MKRTAAFILFFLCCLCCRGINIPHKFGCDTLFMKGSYAQLKQVETNILNELKKPNNQATTAALHSLMGDDLVALGRYADAVKWYEQAVELFRAIDYTKQEHWGDRYYYLCCMGSYVKLLVLMGADSNTIMEYIGKTIDEFELFVNQTQVTGTNKSLSAMVRYGMMDAGYFIATLSSLKREFSTATREYRECIAEIEEVFKGRAHRTMEYAEVLYAIADVYERANDYEQALSYFLQTAEVAEKVAGRNSVLYARTLGRLGGVYYQLNDLDESAGAYKRSIEILQKKGFTAHSELAASYAGMGLVTLNRQEYQACYDYLLKAYEMQKSTCGEGSYRSDLTYFYMAYPLAITGNIAKAWEIVLDVIDGGIGLNLFTDDYLGVASFVYDLGHMQREYDEIIEAHNKFVAHMIKNYGNAGRQNLRNIYLNLGRAYRRKGDYRNAVPQFNRVINYQREMAHDHFTFLTEEQRSNYWAVDESRVGSLFCVNNATGSHAAYVGKLLYDLALLNKGILLEAAVNLAEVIKNSGDLALQKKLSDLHLLRQELTATGRPDNGEAKALESEIVKSARQYGDFMDFVSITWKDVQAGLGKNDVAIEFVSSLYEGVYTYSAEVLRQGMKEPKHIPLFKLPETELSALHAEPGRFSDFACKNIWTSELLACLRPGDNVCFVPSGELYNIGIEYIPLPSGKRMCDVYRMKRLSSTRELTVRKSAQHTRSAALFGGLNYNASVTDMELYAYATAMRGSKSKRFSAQGTAGFDAWGYLPGTGREVESISGSLAPYRYSIQSYMGDEGVEEAFKALSGKQTEIIHIATHGYYLPASGDALEHSGLIFAGANNFWNKKKKEGAASGIDDGILTAREISFLNLQGTDLVVMSACQTGLGRVTGEGVFGLQRAFKKAGVQTLLMSLWEVDDEATQLMMSEFYKAYAEGGDKREALRLAQQKIKQHTFRRNGKEVSGDDPYYWAAFIMMD